MPRRNPKHNLIRKVYQSPSKTKKRYATKELAEKAAEELMLTKPNLSLKVYQDLDLGWYLTRGHQKDDCGIM